MLTGDIEEGPAFSQLVTARHVIEKTGQIAIDGKVLLRANTLDGDSRLVKTEPKDWTFHLSDAAVDAAVLPWLPSREKFLFKAIPEKMVATDEVLQANHVGAGDEIFLTGLFASHAGSVSNLPIIRIGNIALMPEVRVKVREFGMIDAYLVEMRSIGGHSGSPVFVHIGGTR
ncbi:unnamed protein product, partial [marine sediment metagenome]